MEWAPPLVNMSSDHKSGYTLYCLLYFQDKTFHDVIDKSGEGWYHLLSRSHDCCVAYIHIILTKKMCIIIREGTWTTVFSKIWNLIYINIKSHTGDCFETRPFNINMISKVYEWQNITIHIGLDAWWENSASQLEWTIKNCSGNLWLIKKQKTSRNK